MTGPEVGMLALGLLCALIVLRFPVAVALIAVSFGGMWHLIGWAPAVGALRVVPYSIATNWTLSAIPMFLFMGYLAHHSGITTSMFNAARVWSAGTRGGLAVATIAGTSGFAAVTGSSIACASAMGRIAVPEMLKGGYDQGIATGTVAAAGTLGALIPPSLILIVYGIVAQVPIGALFLGGVVVGLMTSLSYLAVVLLRARISPNLFPCPEARLPVREQLRALIDVAPILALILLILGGLFGGLFTATEAGAVGAFACALLALLRRCLSVALLKEAIIQTVASTSAIFLIAVGASLLSRFLAVAQMDLWISEVVTAASPSFYLMIIAIVVLYLILGMFLDPLGAMLLTLPILLPVMRQQDHDLLWFGLLVAKLLEMGMITPPVGMNVFALKSSIQESISVGTIFRGVAWFLVADIVVVAILVVFPSFVTLLPSVIDH